MRYLLMLAAAASLAACHQRSEDEVGAAPDRGDTTAVTATDTTTVTTDSTMGQTPAPSDTSFVGQDTTTVTDTTVTDTTMTPSPSDTSTQQSADTSAAGAWDSTAVSPDTTNQQ